MSHLLVAISAHGLGHLGQAAPVCNALTKLHPNLTLTIWSALPTTTLATRITWPFEHINQPCDLGLIMHDAMRVDVATSWSCYTNRESHWTTHLDAACSLVRSAAPDLILSNVGDMPLAAAQILGIPSLAMSSLNWADTARFYFETLPNSAPVMERLTNVYNNVPLTLRLSPGMPMRGLKEYVLPPVATLSTYSRELLEAKLAQFLNPALRHRPRILIGMGGIEMGLNCTQWPEQSTANFLVTNQPHLPPGGLIPQGITNADALCTQTGLVFSDLLGCCDAVICKPGYGTFVEAALADTPVLYVEREDWPEQRVLVRWLETNARCAKLDLATLRQGLFSDAIDQLLTIPKKPPIRRDGAMVAAQEILRWLSASEAVPARLK